MKGPAPAHDPRGLSTLPLYLLLRGLTISVCLAPRPLVDAWARALGWLFYRVIRATEARQNLRGRGVLRNMQIAFGEALSREEREALARRYSLHAARLAFEVLRLPRLTTRNWEQVVDFSELDALLRERQHPLIVTTGHFGNWEVLAYAGGLRGDPPRSLGRPLPIAGLQRWLREHRARSGADFRTKFAGSVGPELSGLLSLKQAVSDGGLVGLNVDEDVRRKGQFVPFCGVLASTHTSAAVLQRATKAKIAIVTCQRVGLERFKVHLWDVIEHDPGRPRESERERVCAAVAAGLEAALRSYPDQWLWTLRRWKTRPAGEAESPLPQRVEPGRAPKPLAPLRPSWTLRLGLTALALCLLSIPAFLLGPRRVADPSRLRIRLQAEEPAALAAEISRREAGLAGITSGCAARVVFANPASPAQTDVAVVYVHGFSATRQETAPLAENLARAWGANLFEARLRGHGRGGAALGVVRCEEWLSDAAEAIEVGRRLGRRVVVISCSTGSSLVAWLISHGHAERVVASIWISPNFAPRNSSSRILTGPWGAQLVEPIVGPERSWTPSNELQGRYWTTRYPSSVLVEMQATVDLANRADLARHQTPLLMIYSPRDRILSPAAMERRFADVGAARKEAQPFLDDTDPVHHVLAGAVLSPGSTADLVARIRAFADPLLAPQ